MDWTSTLSGARGRRDALKWMLRTASAAEQSLFVTLVILDPSPEPPTALTAATLAVSDSPMRTVAPLVLPLLAPQVRAATSAWRSHPTWARTVVGDHGHDRLIRGVASIARLFRGDAATLDAIVTLALHDGDAAALDRCAESLGADGWRAADPRLRAEAEHRMRIATPTAFGFVWDALDDAQRVAVVQRLEDSDDAAELIGRIGAAAWQATDRTLRRRLIETATLHPWRLDRCASAWGGMDDDEIASIAAAAADHESDRAASALLSRIGRIGRKRLGVNQRAALERSAAASDAWTVFLLRAQDFPWSRFPRRMRDRAILEAERAPDFAAALLCAVGTDGWRAMSRTEQEGVRIGALRQSSWFFRCPPALWADIAAGVPPPIAACPYDAAGDWTLDDLPASLPPLYHTLALGAAPWNDADGAGAGRRTARRMTQLLAAWRALSDSERRSVAHACPHALPAVAVAARRRRRRRVQETIAEAIAWAALADRAPQDELALLIADRTHNGACWRAAMEHAVVTEQDSPEVWEAWRKAARRGWVGRLDLCARSAASPPPHRLRTTS